MPALQVRDFPQDLYSRLQQCAADEHRSIAQQTVAIVERYLWDKEQQALTPSFVTLRTFDEGAAEARARKRQALFARIEERGHIGGLEGNALISSLHADREERMGRSAARSEEGGAL